MKPILDKDFFGYIEYAIKSEQDRIRKLGMNPDAAPSQWLLILTVIKKGSLYMFQKEIWEDITFVGYIVTQGYAEVRRTLLEYVIATLPKASWTQFKKVCLNIADSFEREEPPFDPNYPWLPDSVRQLKVDIQALLPDWMIEGLLTDFDRDVMKREQSRMSFLFKLSSVPSQKMDGSLDGRPMSPADYDSWLVHDMSKAYDSWKKEVEVLKKVKCIEDVPLFTTPPDNEEMEYLRAEREKILPGAKLFNERTGKFYNEQFEEVHYNASATNDRLF